MGSEAAAKVQSKEAATTSVTGTEAALESQVTCCPNSAIAGSGAQVPLIPPED